MPTDQCIIPVGRARSDHSQIEYEYRSIFTSHLVTYSKIDHAFKITHLQENQSTYFILLSFSKIKCNMLDHLIK